MSLIILIIVVIVIVIIIIFEFRLTCNGWSSTATQTSHPRRRVQRSRCLRMSPSQPAQTGVELLSLEREDHRSAATKDDRNIQ